MTEYQTELGRLLKLSTVAPGLYAPTEEVKHGTHVAVFIGDKPILLCGPSDDPESVTMASAFALSPYFKHINGVAGNHGEPSVGYLSGQIIKWQEKESAIVEKLSGQVEDGNGEGSLIAIVLNDPKRVMAVAMCINTETARIFDHNVPELDDGGAISKLAKVENTENNQENDFSLS